MWLQSFTFMLIFQFIISKRNIFIDVKKKFGVTLAGLNEALDYSR